MFTHNLRQSQALCGVHTQPKTVSGSVWCLHTIQDSLRLCVVFTHNPKPSQALCGVHTQLKTVSGSVWCSHTTQDSLRLCVVSTHNPRQSQALCVHTQPKTVSGCVWCPHTTQDSLRLCVFTHWLSQRLSRAANYRLLLQHSAQVSLMNNMKQMSYTLLSSSVPLMGRTNDIYAGILRHSVILVACI